MPVDYSKVEAVNQREFQLGTMTLGNPSDPCVLIPPGGGALKPMSLLWARDLAQAGPFFVILWDLRGSGESERLDYDKVFGPFGTTPELELKRMYGGVGEEGTTKSDEALGIEDAKNLNAAYEPPAGILEQCFDVDAHALDAIRIMDRYKIEKAHLMGLSQGGNIVMLTALQYPDRVLTCVPCAPAYNEMSMMMGGNPEATEDFYDKMKELGNPPKFGPATTRKEYTDWWVPNLDIIMPGFSREAREELCRMQYDHGFMTEDDVGLQTLALRNFEKAGKQDRRDEQLKKNKVPMMVICGKKDPLVWDKHAERLFRMAANCEFHSHEYGHNFGPPAHQQSMMRMVASWMKKNANRVQAPDKILNVGSDTHATGVSADLGVTAASDLKQIYDVFCQVQTAADTGFVFDLLVGKLQLQHLKGRGLRLFKELSAALNSPGAGLAFKQKKLLQDLEKTLARQHKVVARVRKGDTSEGGPSASVVSDAVQQTIKKYFPDAPEDDTPFNKVLICGAGPVGLRVGCELALLGFDVHIAEKRTNFSRANILTFWDDTFADMLSLGMKSYFPDMASSGDHKFLGTRQIQVCLLKTLLLLGGRVEYGCEICGLVRPASEGMRWRANFRPYAKGRRTQEAATDWQKSKDYAGDDGVEGAEVDEDFLTGGTAYATTFAYFDMYIIAEGGWSDSTRRLGFEKCVEKFKSIFGLVINVNYNMSDLKEKGLKSQVHFLLSGNFPLQLCKVKTEFIEYLKGETHFFALVVQKNNADREKALKYLADMEKRDDVPEAALESIRFSASRLGLLEMGVFKENKPTGRELLAKDNVDVGKLYELAREIVTEMGLPETAQFYPTNPVQLFDFSRRARCIQAVRVLSSDGQVSSPDSYSGTGRAGDVGDALVFPVGDALQEPNWTEGTGVNRGFQTGMNQAYACLVARESGLHKGIEKSVKAQSCILGLRWSGGGSGLAGRGCGCTDLKPFAEWNTDPRSRFNSMKL